MSSFLTFRTFLRNLVPRFPMFFGLRVQGVPQNTHHFVLSNFSASSVATIKSQDIFDMFSSCSLQKCPLLKSYVLFCQRYCKMSYNESKLILIKWHNRSDLLNPMFKVQQGNFTCIIGFQDFH